MPKPHNLNDFYRNKKVLVTGGAGFIGSNLVDKLVDLEANVTVLDNFSTGKMENLKQSLHKIRLINGDITSKESCREAVCGQEVVFHTAAKTAVSSSQQDQEELWKVNVFGTENILKNCNKISTFIFSSSAAVYGNRENACCEDDQTNPISKYGQSKAFGEDLCRKYGLTNKFKTVVLRYFNVFGNRQDKGPTDSSVLVKFMKALIGGQTLTIFGDGQQRRDFVNVSKIVRANLLTAAFSDKSYDIFNVANGKSISLLELIQALEINLGIKGKNIIHKPALSCDIFSSQANCSKYNDLTKKYLKYIGAEEINDEPIKSDINLYSNCP